MLLEVNWVAKDIIEKEIDDLAGAANQEIDENRPEMRSDSSNSSYDHPENGQWNTTECSSYCKPGNRFLRNEVYHCEIAQLNDIRTQTNDNTQNDAEKKAKSRCPWKYQSHSQQKQQSSRTNNQPQVYDPLNFELWSHFAVTSGCDEIAYQHSEQEVSIDIEASVDRVKVIQWIQHNKPAEWRCYSVDEEDCLLAYLRLRWLLFRGRLYL